MLPLYAAPERRDPSPARPTQVPNVEATTVLVDALVHDARNPLNAISIHLEVMAERFRREQGAIAPSHEKSLKTMSEQVGRVDAILRLFADLLAPRATLDARPDLSALVKDALAGIGHECRKRQVALRWELDEPLRVSVPDVLVLRAFLVDALVGAALRTSPGMELQVQLVRRPPAAELTLRGGDLEPLIALTQAAAARIGAHLFVRPGAIVVEIPLALDPEK